MVWLAPGLVMPSSAVFPEDLCLGVLFSPYHYIPITFDVGSGVGGWGWEEA